MSILDRMGNIFSLKKDPNLKAAPADLTRQNPITPYYDHWRQIIANVKPAELRDLLHNAELGQMLFQCEFFENALERDAVLSGAFTTRKMAVTKNTWEFIPREGTGSKGKKQADFLTDVARNLSIDSLQYSYDADVLDFEMMLWDALDAVPMGWAMPLLNWKQDGNEWRIVESRHVNQKHTVFGYMGHMPWNPYEVRIRTFDMDNPQDKEQNQMVYGVPLPPFRYLMHQYRGFSGYPTRAGLMRTMSWLYLLKWYGLEGAAIYVDLYGIPLRIGKYDEASATKADDIRVLKQAVKGLGRDAWAVIGKSMEIDFKEPSGGRSANLIHKEFIEMCDSQMLIGILGQSGTTLSVAGKLGEEKEKGEVRDDIMQADARALEKCIQYRFVAPQCLFNQGEVYCDFKIHYEKEEDQNSKADRYQKLSTFIELPKSHVYETFNIPEPEEGEPTTSPKAAAGPAPALKRVALRGGSRRAERHAKIIEASKKLDGIIDAGISSGLKAYELLVEGIEDFTNEKALAAGLKRNRPKFEEALGAALDESLGQSMALANSVLGVKPKVTKAKAQHPDLFALSGKFRVKDSTAQDFVKYQSFTVRTIEGERITQELIGYVKDNVTQALEDGLTPVEFRQQVMEGVGLANIGDIRPSHVDLVFRMNIATAHSVSKYYAFNANKKFFPCWEYMAIEDASTTELCLSLNGKIFPNSDTTYWPENHFNCRSEASPIDALEQEDENYQMSGTGDIDGDPDKGFGSDPVTNYANYVSESAQQYPAIRSELNGYEE